MKSYKFNIKKAFLFAIIATAAFGLSSCAKKDINEPAGLSEYRINNQSGKTLIFKTSPETQILDNEIKKIDSDGGIGIVAPLPSIGLGSLKLYRDEMGNEIIAFEQDPVIDSEWTEEKQDNQEYGLVYYTITITENMIN